MVLLQINNTGAAHCALEQPLVDPPNHLKLTVTFPNRFARFQVHSIPLQILREETWKNLSEHSSKDPNWKGFYSALDWRGVCE
jgi:hypothetical protein